LYTNKESRPSSGLFDCSGCAGIDLIHSDKLNWFVTNKSWTVSYEIGAYPNIPTDDNIDISRNPTLEWISAEGETTYDVQVSKVLNFATTVIDENLVSGTSYSVSGLESFTLYYWRVKHTGATYWSTVFSFTTALSISNIDSKKNRIGLCLTV